MEQQNATTKSNPSLDEQQLIYLYIEVISKAIKFSERYLVPEIINSYDKDIFLKNFRSLTLRGPRASGHTSAIKTMAMAFKDVSIVFTTTIALTEIFRRAGIKAYCSYDAATRALIQKEMQKRNLVFVDDAGGLLEYAKASILSKCTIDHFIVWLG